MMTCCKLRPLGQDSCARVRSNYTGHMIKTSVTNAKSRLSELLQRVIAGETVLILMRGKPIARIEPIRESDLEADDDARMARLEKAGLLRRGSTGMRIIDIVSEPIVIGSRGGVLSALLEERRTGR